jgi:hypothetical protein
MRTLSRLTALALVACAAASAQAADLRGGEAAILAEPAYRSALVTIYDYEPGVYTRAYWSPPWANRRYYPITGKKPRYGRHENLRARSDVQEAEPFYREWSTSWVGRVMQDLPPPQK